MGVAPRTAVVSMGAYRHGRTAREVMGSFPVEALARLASNESPFPPLPSVLAAIADHAASSHRYPEPRSATLRVHLARVNGVDPSSVATGAGSVGLLWQIGQTFLEPGREMVAPWPSFEGYPLIAQLTGSRHVPVELVDHRVDVDALLRALGDRTDLVVIAQPNNPTGTALTTAEVLRLVDGTSGRCVLVLDEAYLEFGDDPGDATASLLASNPHLIVLRTFSKAHGLAGLRVGYALAAPPIVELLDRVAPPFSVSSVGQAAAIASLDDHEALGARVALVASERGRVTTELRRRGFDIPASATNFVWLPAIATADHLASELEQRGVLVRPITGHGVRVTIGTPDENDRFLDALALVSEREVVGA